MIKKWFHLVIFNLFSFVVLEFFFTEIKSTLISVSISPFPEIDLTVSILLDKMTFSFLLMSMGVSVLVFKYAIHYMNKSLGSNKFFWTLFIFAVSMFVLCMSSNLFWLLAGWDGLGLSSFCLILFYSSRNSFNSGMVTFISNRIGDLFILLSIGLLFYFNFHFSWEDGAMPVSLGILVGAISKSAQIPFSAWLPLAMAAPTPVSSLVHSSTLVTAGVYLISRFQLTLSNETFLTLMFVSSITLLLAGSSSLFETDLKKIIALSTMSHVAFMFFFISIGDQTSAMIHMVAHAFFKSLLFMSAGHVIHISPNQDIRCLSLLPQPDSFFWMVFLISMMSMGGLPFLAGFYSKELCLYATESASGLSLFFCFSFFSGVFFSVAYSIRVLMIIFQKASKAGPSTFFSEELGWGFVFVLGSVGSVISSSLLTSVFFLFKLNFFDELFKLVLLLSMVGGTVAALVMSEKVFFRIPSFFLGEMWHLGTLGVVMQPNLFNLSYFSFSKVDSKGALDWVIIFLEEKLSELYGLSKNHLFFSGGLVLMLAAVVALLIVMTLI